eukprot:3528232-Rhodomonas_salina.4
MDVYTAKSNARNHITVTNCTEIANHEGRPRRGWHLVAPYALSQYWTRHGTGVHDDGANAVSVPDIA